MNVMTNPQGVQAPLATDDLLNRMYKFIPGNPLSWEVFLSAFHWDVDKRRDSLPGLATRDAALAAHKAYLAEPAGVLPKQVVDYCVEVLSKPAPVF